MYETGKSSPGTLVYRLLIEQGVSIDWLLNGFGSMELGSSPLDGYTFLPLYAATGGLGEGVGDDTIIDWVAFKQDWIKMELHVNPSNLMLIVSEGDSMIPTITSGDLLIIDGSCQQISGDGIYVLNLFGKCLVKRIQSLFDKTVRIFSDNPAYKEQIISGDDLSYLSIVGKVIWHGGRV